MYRMIMYRMILYRSGSNLTSEADKEVRGWNRPFDHVPDDHVPVWLELDIRKRQRGTGMEQAI